MRRLILIAALCLGSSAWAQNAAPAAESAMGVKSANIFQLAPDADADPKYKEQSNAERGKVQPGNNAPVWRQVGQGVTGYRPTPGWPMACKM